MEMGADFEFVKTLLDTYKAGINEAVKQISLEGFRDALDTGTYDLSDEEKSEIKSEINKELEEMGVIVKAEVEDELFKEGWGLHIEKVTIGEAREHIRVMKSEEPEYEWKTVKRPDGLLDVYVRTKNNSEELEEVPSFKEALGDKTEKSDPEAKLAEIIVTLKTNPDGLSDTIEEGISPEMKEKISAAIRTRMARKGFIEAIDWERNVANCIGRCEQEGGICQFRTRYAGKRFEDSQNPGKYLVLFICYGKRWSQWFGNVSEEDVERLEAD